MAFHEVRLPSDISFGSSGGPQFVTNIITTQSGYEQRNTNWSQARCSYNIVHAVKDSQQIELLIEFFRARQGRAYGFRFKDWADYEVSSQEIGIGDGVKTDFQLIKTYSSGGTEVSRDIKKPVSGTVKVYFDNVEQSIGWTIDTVTGILMFRAAPSADVAITADFEFDVPVRFNTDYLQSEFDTYGVSSIRELPLVEVRV